MTTLDRIQLLAESAQSPEFLGNFTDQDLIDWVSAELGHPETLDSFTPHGPLMSRAIAPQAILHIVSGNTPHAAIQSVLRGLLLGSHNIIKLPSSGLPELLNWLQQLPPELQKLTETHTELTSDHWKSPAIQAVIAIGSDDTIAQIQQKIRPDQRFIPHGHKISIGIVSRKPHPTRPNEEAGSFKEAAELAAKDICAYQQKGCLSPHAIYINESVQGDALSFCQFLAEAMDTLTRDEPASQLSLSEAGSIRNLRETTRFRAANTKSTNEFAIWESANSLNWTVICETSPTLKLSCLNRCIYVKPLPKNLSKLGKETQHLSTISLYPFDLESAANISEQLPTAHRICPLGQSQTPTLFWHHDGFAPLASLVKWKDLG